MAINLGSPLNFGTAPNVGSPDYGFTQSYKQALQANQQLYAQALSGYQQVLQAQQQRSQDLAGRYDQLGASVLGQLQGAEGAEQERIKRQYDALSGETQQSAANRGLGNFTILDSLQRGVESDRSLANLDLGARFGQMRASAIGQYGLAGLGYRQQAGAEQDAMSQAALQWMGSWRQDTPDPLGYAQLAQQQKQWQAEQPYEYYDPGAPPDPHAVGIRTQRPPGEGFKMFDPRTGKTIPGRGGSYHSPFVRV